MRYTPDTFAGSDNERVQAAINAAAAAGGGTVVVPPRVPDAASRRTYWLLDHAILLPSDITLVLDGCKLKLSDHCRDNFIRSANCGIGVTDVRPLHNIHIVGEGHAVLEGADRPRASGDSAKTKTLSSDAVWHQGAPYVPVSYGSDADKPDAKKTGDWRNIGVLLAAVEGFSLRNLTLVDAHAWGISLEHCCFGTIRDLVFSAQGGKEVDGAFRLMRNQDGLDLRQGCHDITIDGVSGNSGDDLVALTAIRDPSQLAGSLESTMVTGFDPDVKREHVYNIIIRNIRGSAGGNQLIRFLNTGGIEMHTIVLDGVIDTASGRELDRAVVTIGDSNPTWGGITPLGETRGFIITNVQGRAQYLVEIRGSLCDSVISNLIYTEQQHAAVAYTSGREHVRNLTIANTVLVRLPDDVT